MPLPRVIALCMALTVLAATSQGGHAFGEASPKEDALSQFRGEGAAPSLTRGLRGARVGGSPVSCFCPVQCSRDA